MGVGQAGGIGVVAKVKIDKDSRNQIFVKEGWKSGSQLYIGSRLKLTVQIAVV